MRVPIENFSDAYYQLPTTNTRGYTGDRVIGPLDLVGQLSETMDPARPVVKIGTGHYWLEPEHGVPADTIAVPFESEIPTDADPVLVPKNDAAREIVRGGGVNAPV